MLECLKCPIKLRHEFVGSLALVTTSTLIQASSQLIISGLNVFEGCARRQIENSVMMD